jgi:hypothetical protein
VSVFATFRSEEGYQRALVFNDPLWAQRPVCGQVFELQKASEPTDIIWENRHYTPETRTNKRLVVYSILVLMLIISGSIIFLFTNISEKLNAKYPKVDYSQVYTEFKAQVEKDYKGKVQNYTFSES